MTRRGLAGLLRLWCLTSTLAVPTLLSCLDVRQVQPCLQPIGHGSLTLAGPLPCPMSGRC